MVPPLVDGYDELRLRVDPHATGKYQVLASNGLAEATERFELPFEQLQLENFILRLSRPRGRRRIDSSAIDDARHFGGELFKALFRGDVHSLYRDTLADARGRGRGRGVRITLCLSGSPELIDVPWEYLFDDPDFLAISALTPVVRYLDLPRAHRPLLVKAPLRLLGVVSNPADYEQLDVARERANLESALATLTESGAVELHWLERPTLGALLQALQAQAFHALHYVGHGTYDRQTDRGALLFEDDGGWARPVSGDKLGMILHDFSSLRLAILNACEGARTGRTDPFAGVAGSLVQRDIPAVVAMQFEISDDAAIVFASGFYRQLAAGSPVDASLAAARLAMLAQRSDDIEWGTPVLFMRVPDGRIFDLGDGDDPGASPGDGLRIVINYRREDTSGHALLLADRLKQQFGSGSVDLPLDGAADDRPARLDGDVAFLALIGSGWAESLKTAAAARHAEDFVRRDLELALRDCPGAVIPVLIDASMPAAETLPRSLRGICRRQPAELRHLSFDQDVTALVARLRAIAGRPPPASEPNEEPGLAPVSGMTAGRTTVGVSTPYDTHFADVVAGILDGAVVPLLGPGITGATAAADQLSDQFAIASAGLAEVAQRVAVTLGERRLYTALKSLVAAQSEPSAVHRFLAELPGLLRRLELPPRHQLIISANYDCALERAFEDANEPFDYAVYTASSGWFVHVPWGERESDPVATTIYEPRKYVGFPIDDDGELARTIIVKIHGGTDGQEGGVTWRNNYVVTEDHYIDYLPTHNIQDHLPIQILDKLTGSRCLFLGYVLRGWDARVFLRRIWRGRPISESSWAIEPDPDRIEKASWSVIGHVELLAASLPEYAGALRAALLDHAARREDLRAPR